MSCLLAVVALRYGHAHGDPISIHPSIHPSIHLSLSTLSRSRLTARVEFRSSQVKSVKSHFTSLQFLSFLHCTSSLGYSSHLPRLLWFRSGPHLSVSMSTSTSLSLSLSACPSPSRSTATSPCHGGHESEVKVTLTDFQLRRRSFFCNVDDSRTSLSCPSCALKDEGGKCRSDRF